MIIDKSTASVDVKTDATVQRVLRESYRGVTMLIIAHRLGTVRDCDQIIEIAEGQLYHRGEVKLSKYDGTECGEESQSVPVLF